MFIDSRSDANWYVLSKTAPGQKDTWFKLEKLRFLRHTHTKFYLTAIVNSIEF